MKKSVGHQHVLYMPFALAIAVYSGVVLTIISKNGLEDKIRIGLYSPLINIFLIGAVVAAIWLLVFFVLRSIKRGEDKPFILAFLDYKKVVNIPNVFGILFPLIGTSLLHSVFTSFKASIGEINPFRFDILLANLDRLLHGGIDPWVITHKAVSSSVGTMWVDLFYTAWFIIIWAFLCWQIIRLNRPTERHQFLIAYVLCWIVIGSLFAYLLSSAGPCYYSMVTGENDIFAPLMERLKQMKSELLLYGDWRDIRALDGQELLRTNYINGSVSPGSGISAMPSMHVSLAVLIALSAWRANKIFGIFMTIYAVIIMFGSVHLGWHYAIDGYVAALLTVIIWYLSGKLIGLLNSITISPHSGSY